MSPTSLAGFRRRSVRKSIEFIALRSTPDNPRAQFMSIWSHPTANCSARCTSRKPPSPPACRPCSKAQFKRFKLAPALHSGNAAFEQSLVESFNQAYAGPDILWTGAPSDPRPYTLFSGSKTYTRPGIAYIALRRILGPANFAAALQQLQRTYRQGSITEAQLEAGFQAFLPTPTTACSATLTQFFTEWFDTVYPPGGGPNRPQITAPGLDGGGFNCQSPSGRQPNPSAPPPAGAPPSDTPRRG